MPWPSFGFSYRSPLFFGLETNVTPYAQNPLGPPSRKMKKRIHPYLEPKLIIHTNGSTYLTGIPLLLLRGVPQSNTSSSDLKDTLPPEPKLLCFGLHYGAHSPSEQNTLRISPRSGFFSRAKEKVQQHLFTSYLIKYLDLPSSAKYVENRTSFRAQLQLAQPINKKLCLVLDTDVISNPL